MAEGKYIAYYRVSRESQGKSGLGLEAQQQAVKHCLNGGGWELLDEHIEVESGKRSINRPKLQEALKACKKHKATLIIAKLDRLARNVHFISGLMESNVEFIAVDNPHANRLMLHMLAAFSEHEREQISIRTKEALAAAKARGVALGKHGKILSQANKQAANDFALALKPIIQDIRERGITTLRATCDELNRMCVPNYQGRGKWHAPSLMYCMRRM